MRQRYVHLHVWGGGLPPYLLRRCILCTVPPTSYLHLPPPTEDPTFPVAPHHTAPHRTAPRRATPPPRTPIERIGCRSRSLLPIGMWERGMASGGCGSLAVLTLLLHARHGAPGCPLLHTDHTPCASLSLSLFSRISIVTIPTQYRHRQGRGEVFGSRPFSDISELHLSPRCYGRPRHPR